jgi:hypothetical protein
MLSLIKNLYIVADYRRSSDSLEHTLRLSNESDGGNIVLMIYRLEPRSGGLRNIARIANAISAHLGKKLQLYIQNESKQDQQLIVDYGFNGKMCGCLPSSAHLFITTSFIFSLSLPDVLRQTSGRWIHIIQDYDELFFPVSTRYYHAAKVKSGPESFIASGKWMRLPGKTAHLPFPVDTSIYNIDSQPKIPREIDVLFFHKPELPRRCALLCEQIAATLLKRYPDLRIAFYGSSLSKWLVSPRVQHLGALPTLSALSDVYRRSKIGVSFNLTNPSLIPFEQMACGCLPISPYTDIPNEFYLPGVHVDGTLNQLTEHIFNKLQQDSLESNALDLYRIYSEQGYLCTKEKFDSAVIDAVRTIC